MNISIRPAKITDAETILHFINELAVYEKEPDAVLNTVAEIEDKLFGTDARAHSVICESEGVAIGFAVYFFNYSTWLGKHGLYLEDLYVSQDKRGSGAGKGIMKYLAQLALEKGCGRFEWVVLDWNKPSIDFYESIGAKAQSEWIIYRLSGQALLDFAKDE
ncbi:GNAT family N-acetyltransferase [Pseudoalteromonas sp. J010]|uniref:GNAT family N-acetyltransferase n=1 Tax=Pseudoalteromonas sp. J010 TaxID=998465 RepID=UPI000F654A7B|nr:GNAT family N-acetyltransferase [Pseudoalteromonas sp. J010]RRS08382.1 GNAT family N-acetyltransferase [Pseudoalteromonas sp. J010]